MNKPPPESPLVPQPPPAQPVRPDSAGPAASAWPRRLALAAMGLGGTAVGAVVGGGLGSFGAAGVYRRLYLEPGAVDEDLGELVWALFGGAAGIVIGAIAGCVIALRVLGVRGWRPLAAASAGVGTLLILSAPATGVAVAAVGAVLLVIAALIVALRVRTA